MEIKSRKKAFFLDTISLCGLLLQCKHLGVFRVSLPFVFGAGLVMIATYVYGVGQKRVSKETVVNGTKEHDKVDWNYGRLYSLVML